MSIAQNIIEIVANNIPKGSEEKVTKIHLKIGELSGIVPDSLLFSFDVLKHESKFSNVTIEIENVPITARCHSCNKVSKLEYGVFFCPNCHSNNIELLTGREINVVDIELED